MISGLILGILIASHPLFNIYMVDDGVNNVDIIIESPHPYSEEWYESKIGIQQLVLLSEKYKNIEKVDILWYEENDKYYTCYRYYYTKRRGSIW